MNISFAVVFNFLLVTPRGKVVMSYLIGGFGGTVHVSILPVFWLLHFHGISGVTLTFPAGEMLSTNQRRSAGTLNTFALEETPDLCTSI